MIVDLCKAPYVRKQVETLLLNAFGTKKLPEEIYVKIDESGYVLKGTFSIDEEDLPNSTLGGPWLSDLFVVKRFRGEGIVDELIKFSISKYDKLYAWCCNPMYFTIFTRNGFKFLCSEEHPNIITKVGVFVYNKNLD